MKKKLEKNMNNISKSKKISFFSAILIVIGSSVGAGIFFKSQAVLNNSQGSFIFAIFCWIIASISVIAMGLALIEIASARNDNLSLLGWVKVFSSRINFLSAKNFMFYVYMPLTYFFMPMYVVMSLQDGIGAMIGDGSNPFQFGTNFDWLIWVIIAFAISFYFIMMSGMSTRIGNIQNKFITYLKFIPLVFVAIIGFVLVAINKKADIDLGFTKPEIVPGIDFDVSLGSSLSVFSPGLGLFLSISAIFFAFDGFYFSAGIQSEMKSPKKTPLAILIGLSITTIIYLIIAISMSINGGSFVQMREDMQIAFQNPVAGNIIYGIINILISIGILGIINGVAMWTPRFIENLIQEGELPFSFKFKNKINSHKPIVGIKYSLITTIPIFFIFSLIGALGYIDTIGYGDVYGNNMGSLYSFADLMSSWTSVFAFWFIATSIYGGLRNRRTEKVETIRNKFFIPAGIVTIVLVSLSLFTTILIPIFDFFLLFALDKKAINDLVNDSNSNLPITYYNDILISRIMTIVTMVFYVMGSYLPILIEDKKNIKKHGSLTNYYNWQKINFNIQ